MIYHSYQNPSIFWHYNNLIQIKKKWATQSVKFKIAYHKLQSFMEININNKSAIFNFEKSYSSHSNEKKNHKFKGLKVSLKQTQSNAYIQNIKQQRSAISQQVYQVKNKGNQEYNIMRSNDDRFRGTTTLTPQNNRYIQQQHSQIYPFNNMYVRPQTHMSSYPITAYMREERGQINREIFQINYQLQKQLIEYLNINRRNERLLDQMKAQQSQNKKKIEELSKQLIQVKKERQIERLAAQKKISQLNQIIRLRERHIYNLEHVIYQQRQKPIKQSEENRQRYDNLYNQFMNFSQKTRIELERSKQVQNELKATAEQALSMVQRYLQ